MTTSWSSHHRGTRLQRAQRPSVGLEQGALEAYTEDYFKINAYPGSSGGGVRGGFPRLLLMKATGFQWWWRERGFPQSLLMKATGGSHGEW